MMMIDSFIDCCQDVKGISTSILKHSNPVSSKLYCTTPSFMDLNHTKKCEALDCIL